MIVGRCCLRRADSAVDLRLSGLATRAVQMKIVHLAAHTPKHNGVGALNPANCPDSVHKKSASHILIFG